MNETLQQYLAKPSTVSKITKGSYLFGIGTTILVMAWTLYRFIGTDYMLMVIPQTFIGWGLWKGYRGMV